MKRWDCFLFFDELELLELRLTMLDEVVDRFVICESPWPHTPGAKHPLWFKEHEERFAPWADRIVHVVSSSPPQPAQGDLASLALLRERWQRSHLRFGFRDAGPDDIITYSDVDEIPDPNAYVHLEPGMCLGMSWDVFYVGLRSYEKWWGCVAGRPKDDLVALHYSRFWDLGPDRHGPYLPFIHHGGWHLSWMGGKERIRRKQESYCHPQYQDVEIEECLADLHDVYGSPLRPVPVTEALYPAPLVSRLKSDWRDLAWAT